MLALFAPPGKPPWETVCRQLDTLDAAVPARQFENVRILVGLEGCHAIDTDISRLQTLWERGVRLLGLTWNNDNPHCGGIANNTYGLTDLGREAVTLWESLGGTVDVSHASERGFEDTLSLCRTPVIASHSCCKALCGHRRNLTDAQLKELGDKGGVVGVNFYPSFLSDSGKATLDDVVRHIHHALNAAGEDAVGIGSDFDGIKFTPAGLEGAEKLPELVKALQIAGIHDRIIEKVMGENFYRIFPL